MGTSMDTVNKKIASKSEKLAALKAEEEALRKRSSAIRRKLQELRVEKHIRLSEESPINYEEDRESLDDLVEFARDGGSGLTLLQDWIQSFEDGKQRGLTINWDYSPGIAPGDDMPIPYIFLTDFYGPVNYEAKTEAASRLARAININGQARFLIEMRTKRKSQLHQEYMVSGENYDQWRLAPGRYEMDDPQLVVQPFSSLPELLKDLYENS